MQRLTNDTLQPFLKDAPQALLLFGAPQGASTMRQALEFADAWADYAERAAFGYIDAFDNVAAARSFSIRVLPTTLVVAHGEIAARLEGVHTSAALGAALFGEAAHNIAA